MARTFAIGDIHGDLEALDRVLAQISPDVDDTIVFLGDYLDRGPCSAEVVRRVRTYHTETKAHVVALRGNHEDAWVRIVTDGWPEFVFPRSNGCHETLRSYRKHPQPREDEMPTREELEAMMSGSFFPPEDVEWMKSLPLWYEDEHAIYVHAGIPGKDGKFPHPSAVRPSIALMWCRDREFFRDYRGKLVVFGHTSTHTLPPELSSYTPEDPLDMWAGPATVGLDTGCGKGGFLTALELPSRRVYESRLR